MSGLMTNHSAKARGLAPASRRRARLLPSIGAVLAFIVSSYVPGNATDRAINIGVLTDMAGLYKELSGEGSVTAAKMAVEDFGGKAIGAAVRVYVGDHKHNVSLASSIADDWFKTAHVGLVVDMPNSAVALAVQKLASANCPTSTPVRHI